MKDALGYYEILEINSVEDIADIKSKYHKLAKYWHPDSNKDPQAMEHFQKISVAYEVLSDEEKRLKYDMLSQIYNSSNSIQRSFNTSKESILHQFEKEVYVGEYRVPS